MRIIKKDGKIRMKDIIINKNFYNIDIICIKINVANGRGN